MVDSRAPLAQDGRRAERLELRVPTTATQLPAVRAMAGDLAIRMDYDLDAVEDLRLAVDEACATLSQIALGDEPLTVIFETTRAGLHIEAWVPTAEGTEVPRDGFGWAILATLVDAVDARRSTQAEVPAGERQRHAGRCHRHGQVPAWPASDRGRKWCRSEPLGGPVTRFPSTDETPVVEVPLPDQRSEETRGTSVEQSAVREEPDDVDPVDGDAVPDPRAANGSAPAPADPAAEAATEVADVAPDAPPISDNRRRAERTAPLFAELATLEKGDPRRERLREILVEEHLPLVRHFARRFSNRGEPFDDLLQVGTLGLIAAIDRFDPDPWGRVPVLRRPHDHRRDQAALPRPGLVGPRAAPAAGAAPVAERGRGRAGAEERPGADAVGAGRAPADPAGRGPRGPRRRQRLPEQLAGRAALGRGRLPHPRRDAGRGGRRAGGRGVPGVAAAAAGHHPRP